MIALLVTGLVLFVVAVVLTVQDRWSLRCLLGRHRFAPTYCSRCGEHWS